MQDTANISTARLVLILGVASMLGPLTIDMYLPGFATIAADLESTSGQVQFSLASFSIGMAVGQIFWGPFSDTHGRKAAFLFGGLLFVAATLACGLASTMDELITYRFLQGLGGCCFMVTTRAVVRDCRTGVEAVRLFSLIVVVLGVSPVVAPMLGSLILRLGEWRHIFWVITACAVVSLLLISAWLPETHPSGKRATGGLTGAVKGYLRVFRDGKFLRLCALLSMTSMGFFAYITGSSAVFMDAFGFSAEAFSLVFGSNAVALIAAAQINSRIIKHFGPVPILKTAISGYIFAALLLGTVVVTATGWLAYYGALFALVFCVGFVLPTGSALAMESRGDDAGTASSVMGIMQFGMGAVGGVLVGVLHDGSSAPLAYVLALVAIMLAASTSACLKPYGDRFAPA